jgi:methionyl-tRNA formyltransferase
VVAYGALLPQSALDIPAHGWVNLHFSLLPSWRGAAPVQHAILRGDDVTGASTFRIVKELDAGPVYGVLTEPVRPDDTTGSLLERLSHSGAELLVATLDGIETGAVQAIPQPAEGVSFAPKITPADARVDWKLPAHVVDRQIRACTPDPGAWTELDGARLKLGPVSLESPADLPDLAPAELLAQRQAVFVGTGSRPVRLGDVQAEGKRQMAAFRRPRAARLTWPSRPAALASPALASPALASPEVASPNAHDLTTPAPAILAPGRRAPTRPGTPPTTCCAPSRTGMPTPTCCCLPCSGSAA